MHREFVSLLTTAAFVVYTAAIAAGAEQAAPAAAVGKAAAAPEKSAQLSVLTGGETCTVYVDGRIMGDSPVTFPIEAGKHKVQAVPFRGKSKAKTVTIKQHENLEVHFDFPLPKPVEAAMKGNYDRGEDDSFFLGLSEMEIAFGVCAIALIGAAVVVANSNGSSHSEVSVQGGTLTASFRTDQLLADGDKVAVYLNGSKTDEFTLDTLARPITFTLKKGMNTITIEALNEGTVPGNTGMLAVPNGSGGTTPLYWNLPAYAMQSFPINVP